MVAIVVVDVVATNYNNNNNFLMYYLGWLCLDDVIHKLVRKILTIDVRRGWIPSTVKWENVQLIKYVCQSWIKHIVFVDWFVVDYTIR